jgi:hypothetical protein
MRSTNIRMWRARTDRKDGASSRESDEFEPGKEVADLKGSGLRSVGAVSTIVADIGAEVVTNCARCGLFRIGGPHGVAPLLDRAFCFKYESEDFAGAHEAGELAKEGALFMDSIEASGFALSEDHRLDGHDAEASFVNAGENLTLKVARYGVGLDDCKGTFDSQEKVLQIEVRA